MTHRSTDPHRLDEKIKDRARALRSQITTPEQLLWSRLRSCRLAGLKFRRQQPINPYIVDFYCHDHQLVVELDGMTHVGRGGEDDLREKVLVRQGLRVLRFTNDDVVKDLDVVVEAIARACGVDV